MIFTVSGMATDIELQKLLTAIRIDEWLREDLFHFRWWFLLGLFIFSILGWWKLVDKRRLPEVSLYAALTTFVTLAMDEYGEELARWDYPTDVFPIFPPLTAIDLASLPMIYSLIYQYFGGWKTFMKATIVMAAIFSFVFEPILVWGGFYQLLKWKYYYGFPIYIIMALLIRWIVVTIYDIAQKAK